MAGICSAHPKREPDCSICNVEWAFPRPHKLEPCPDCDSWINGLPEARRFHSNRCEGDKAFVVAT